MDEKDKEKQRERYARYMRKHVDRDEQQRRRASSRARRAGRRPSRPRRDGWSGDDDVTFEKINRAGGPAARRRPEHLVDPDLPQATVISVHHGRVELDTGGQARIAPHLAVDPDLQIAVGDRVAVSAREGPSRIEGIAPRASRLARPDPGNPNRELVLAANVDLAVVVVAAAKPPLRVGLIDRILLALSRGDVLAAICVNKVDLLSGREREDLEAILAPYRELDLPILVTSAATSHGLTELRRCLAGKTCVLVGHSGVGKSSILNALDPRGDRATGELTDRGRGRHTTTWSSLRDLGSGTRVVDTPGIRAFGLQRLEPVEVRDGFPEFAPFAARCRYGDCTHVSEPRCGVRDAAESGDLPRARYASYLRILQSLEP